MNSILENLLKSIEENPYLYGSLIVALLELFLRLKPTEKNLSIIDFLHRMLNVIFPNKNQDGTKHE